MASQRLSNIERLFSAETNASFVGLFFRQWTPGLICLFGRVSWSFRMVAEWYCTHAWNVDGFLRNWFPLPRHFRVILVRTGAVISGPQALYFFDRVQDRAAPLDVYVAACRVRTLVDFLLLYRYTHSGNESQTRSRSPCDDTAISALVPTVVAQRFRPKIPGDHLQFAHPDRTFSFFGTFLDEHTLRLSLRTVNVHVTNTEPVKAILRHSPFSDGAFSMFPDVTFEQRLCVSCKGKTGFPELPKEWLKKYLRSTFYSTDRWDEALKNPMHVGWRRAVDKDMWVMEFDFVALETSVDLKVEDVRVPCIRWKDPYSATADSDVYVFWLSGHFASPCAEEEYMDGIDLTRAVRGKVSGMRVYISTSD
ncbi:hypothetical protein PLICRDRAFT_30599 [Plicaturopsis crispa FD-325 SS-3]|nr:hypothetical protein PLICRDRAFT_30599 [Plicaturopsis crispa FD-325 SS-3]